MGAKVLLTSGYPDLKTSHLSDKLPQWAVLKKPYRRDELQRVLQDALRNPFSNGLAQALSWHPPKADTDEGETSRRDPNSLRRAVAGDAGARFASPSASNAPQRQSRPPWRWARSSDGQK
jgi:hypothetical protein